MLGLGFAASASAVVPGFDRLIHGNKPYLAVTSLVGLVALAGGVQMLLSGSELGVGVLVGAMGVLWLIATIHHAVLAEGDVSARSRVRPPRHRPRRPESPDRDVRTEHVGSNSVGPRRIFDG